ncbi:MAG: DUF1552 domain-containing protein [Polyangiaceae bacterium]
MSRRRLSHELILGRRTVLRGAVGGSLVALALPLLEAMQDPHGEKLANGAELPRRLVTWMFGNGCRLEHFTPLTTGTGYAITPELEPLAALRDHFTVLSGFRNYVAGRRGHHDGMAGFFSCHPFIQLDPMGAPYASKFGGPSFDQLVADIVGTDTFYPSLQLGVSKRFEASQGPTLQTMSHRGPDQPLAMERDPGKVYEALFMSFMPPDDPTAGLRAQALDAVLNDAQRLKRRVSSDDRTRIDAHLESIFQVQKQLLAIPPSCDVPPKPDVPLYNEDMTEPLMEINAVMAQLVTLAFSCDLTRVISFMFTGASGAQQFHMLPPSAFPQYPGAKDYSHSDHHQVSHMNLPYEQDFIHAAAVVAMEALAYLLEQLRSHDEGTTTLLDQSCVLAVSDVAEGWAHSEIDHPIIVAGNAGGRLKQGVGHYRSPDEQPIHDISLACAKSVLPDPTAISELGSVQGNYAGLTTTPCDAIFAG